MPYTRRPFNYTGTLPNQVENDLGLADDNFDILAQAFVNDDPASGVVKNADMLDGFHASQTPAPNVILPLNANGRIYNYVAYGAMRFDPPDFTMSNNTEYFIGSVSITTPSWSPSGVWKAIFVVTSWFHSAAGGVNNFQHRVKTANGFTNLGAYWFWNTPYSGSGMGVKDTFIMPDLENNMTQIYSFYVFQGGGSVNAVFEAMLVEWYLIPA